MRLNITYLFDFHINERKRKIRFILAKPFLYIASFILKQEIEVEVSTKIKTAMTKVEGFSC